MLFYYQSLETPLSTLLYLGVMQLMERNMQ